MSGKTKIGTTMDLPDEGSYIIADSEGVQVAVFNIEGEYHGILNYCPHVGGPLCEDGPTGKSERKADVEGWGYNPIQKYVTCPWHNWKFDIETGLSTADPNMRVPTFDVEEDDGELFIEL
jgi:nitrite reductase/ring-hydroxylating ferredoxin subunit